MHTSISLNLISTKSHHQRRRLLTVPLIALVLVLAQLSLGGSRTSLVTEASPTQSILTSSLVGPSSQGGGGIAGGGGGGGGAGSGGGGQESKVFKRSFAGLGCLGVYDKAKFARLDRVCEECYTLYREPDIHSACRQDCFRNSVFTRCVDALLLSHEAKKFDEMVDELYGK